MQRRVKSVLNKIWTAEDLSNMYLKLPKNVPNSRLISDQDCLRVKDLCMYLQKRKEIEYWLQPKDNIEIYLQSWIGSYCNEHRRQMKKIEKRHQIRMTYSNMANTQLDGRRMSAGHVQGRINSMANPGSTDIFLSIPTLSTATTTTSTVTTTMSSRVSDNSTVQRSSQANNELLQQSTPAGGAFQNRNQYFAPPGDRRSEEINLPLRCKELLTV
ncbi:hypothetical protein KQX54_009535 [Cotesia glomerata]|uniref:Uncharacterized protein n=1 Tax=Cotesia glomerata TaxID=32391 RepID=A0AAV7HX23_COTGL|nr:hypothetical protein KQX54_009535 [Cotesia glomerata]